MHENTWKPCIAFTHYNMHENTWEHALHSHITTCMKTHGNMHCIHILEHACIHAFTTCMHSHITTFTLQHACIHTLEQAGVGLMLGEEKGVDGVVVKQLVPRGSADRNGRVRKCMRVYIMYVCVCMYVYIHTYICIHTHIYTCICRCMYVYIDVYARA
jgi:hypothetical protein